MTCHTCLPRQALTPKLGLQGLCPVMGMNPARARAQLPIFPKKGAQRHAMSALCHLCSFVIILRNTHS